MNLKLTRPLAFFDLETTGLNIGVDRIVEIFILKIMPDGTQVSRPLQRLNPEMPISKVSTDIHHITDEMVKDEPTFKMVAHDINNFLENADLAGYNSNRFDIPMLVDEFLRAGVDFDIRNRRFVDVQNIFHLMEQRTLDAAYKFYCGKIHSNSHSAQADTEATYEIFLAQLEKYEGVEYKDKSGNISTPVKNDIKALHDFTNINKCADLAGRIIYNDENLEVFNFGKHKGKLVAEVFKMEPSYYDWMMKGDFPLQTKQVITSLRLRDFNKV